MTGGTLFLIILAIIVFAALGGTVLSSLMRRRRLRKRFGPEYDKVVAQHESRREGEAELRLRKRRIKKLSLAELSTEDRERAKGSLRNGLAFRSASSKHRLRRSPRRSRSSELSCGSVATRSRTIEQTVADRSVEHARVLDRFRSAHAISQKAAADQISTEELRTAMLYCRELFDQLLATEASTDERQSDAKRMCAPSTGRWSVAWQEVMT